LRRHCLLNLEFPLCNNDTPISKSGPAIKASPFTIKAVQSAGFDVVGLANNHIMDYGENGLQETLSVCREHNIKTCDAEINLKEAQQPRIIDNNGVSIAIIAIAGHEFNIATENTSRAAPLDLIDNIRQIDEEKSRADIVIVTIHGGNEYFPFPRPGLRKSYLFYVDKGADAIVCHHSHVPATYEIHNNRPIFYGLGNWIFDNKNLPPQWEYGYAVNLQFNSESSDFEQFHYYSIQTICQNWWY